jgi:hypothetical protein
MHFTNETLHCTWLGTYRDIIFLLEGKHVWKQIWKILENWHFWNSSYFVSWCSCLFSLSHVNCNLYSSPNIVGVIKWKIKWVGLGSINCEDQKWIQARLLENVTGRCHVATPGTVHVYDTCVHKNAKWITSPARQIHETSWSLFLYDSV